MQPTDPGNAEQAEPHVVLAQAGNFRLGLAFGLTLGAWGVRFGLRPGGCPTAGPAHATLLPTLGGFLGVAASVATPRDVERRMQVLLFTF
jgi:hypothetical protein